MNAELHKKMRIAAGQSILMLNLPVGYKELLLPLPEETELSHEPVGEYDVVLLFVSSVAELEAWGPKACDAVKHNALFWIAYPKKSSKMKTDLNRDSGWDVISGKGFEGIALISIDDTWSCMRFRPSELVNTTGTRQERLTTGTKVTVDPTRAVEVPDDLRHALHEVPEIEAFFDGLAYSHRKEYVRWITEAKREETRRSRIEKALDKLGKGIKAPQLKE
ncbi:YdeI/OmpD-associated family protein [Paenibacillus eucommiae]|uniref:Bacteriocin resistance YdeI/OmpD-like protein n=1 Tax=Paenibacillus eucommiae TaxID=1355755 RepID=A0ABS4IML2_9BACL|nr:YdeI/OmpD-associated family protein [Paenibacillus eucommiae]MBP1988812.1 hypothetical protein [Paenibacillus eucommiae]